jgi:hypothetical protein
MYQQPGASAPGAEGAEGPAGEGATAEDPDVKVYEKGEKPEEK